MLENVRIEITEDSSSTLFLPDRNEHYHSVHGAVNEALVVYIGAGLDSKMKSLVELDATENGIYVFEMGLGTALNALLTWVEAEKRKIPVYYTAIEAFPLPAELLAQLNYAEKLGDAYTDFYSRLHRVSWGQTEKLSPYFSLTKIKGDLNTMETTPFENFFDLIYYDAFAPEIQPELWRTACFEKMYAFLKSEGALTTYCAKGQVKRNLKEAGFRVEGLAGPVGKREITRAWKK